MPYISQECMKDFIISLKEDHNFSDTQTKTIKGMLQYFFGYTGEWKMNFRITDGKGFQIKFPNGIILSTQFGFGRTSWWRNRLWRCYQLDQNHTMVY